MDDLLAEFLTETSESLAELDTALLRLERTPNDQATLSLIFRLVHTIKGTCGFLGLPRLETVAHAAENVLVRVRDGELPVTPRLVSAILAALDAIKSILAGLAATGAEPDANDMALIAQLHAAAEQQDATTPEPPPRQAPDPAMDPAGGPQTIRVHVNVLEELMTLVSELVLTRNQLLQLSRQAETRAEAYAASLQRLSHITSDLQEGVMKTRMQPIGTAWNKLPRLVRDLAQELGKKIELVMRGADTELDRQVLDLIRDPLTHMVRNSADHGLETPAERRAVGKPETGRITLTAYHEGGHILIEIADDGRGLNPDRIRAKILENGLATDADLAGMADHDLQRFIFRPGFSTAAAVTAVSGRGVGMDVVKSNVERIGGTIDLASEAGRGTVFTIKIPLTLAIISALIVEAGNERFAIPQLGVVELVRARAATEGSDSTDPVIEWIDNTPVLRLRERLLPLVNLARLLELDGDRATPAGDAVIVVAQVGGTTLGLLVDRVFDTEEIVVKPVAPTLRHITMFSGTTILGDGSVIMILDPNGVARASLIGPGAGDTRARAEPATTSPAPRLSSDRTAMLLFRSGSGCLKSVPLDLVARLEDIPREHIEVSGGQTLVQYRGRLMPLLTLPGAAPEHAHTGQKLMVFSDGGRSMGLMVDDIIDVAEEVLRVEITCDRPGLLGTAVIAGQATEVVDVAALLRHANADWFRAASGMEQADRPHLLVVEDSDFFRQMLMPALSAAGYRVTGVGSAAEALRLREAGTLFDAVISDIEMPDMNGLAFARHVREGGPWRGLPLIALSGRAEPRDIEAGRGAGFTDYVAKFARDALLASLRHCLSPSPAIH